MEKIKVEIYYKQKNITFDNQNLKKEKKIKE